jgi:hypothetical protein
MIHVHDGRSYLGHGLRAGSSALRPSTARSLGLFPIQRTGAAAIMERKP